MPAPRLRTRSSVATIRALLNYDKRNGLLTWRIDRGPKARAGDEAGTLRSDGFISVMVAGKVWLAHHLIWFYVTGELPKGRLAFRDWDPQNLRWHNIMPADEALSQSYSAAYQRKRRAVRREAAKELEQLE